MSLPNRPLPSNLRHKSIGGSQVSGAQPNLLVARVNEKKAELVNLKQLRDLSGGLAAQMQALEDKLSTLADGTEAVAAVLSNWQNVMQAINMASVNLAEVAGGSKDIQSEEISLPHTLVRIPAQQDEESEAASNAK